MPAEAATNVVNIIQLLYTPQNGSGAYAQHHAHFFGADFIVPLDERDDFCIQIVLSDTLTDILGDILRDTIIQVRHNDRKLVAVRTERRALTKQKALPGADVPKKARNKGLSRLHRFIRQSCESLFSLYSCHRRDCL